MIFDMIRGAAKNLPRSIKEADKQLFREFLIFLEDRRVLYNPMEAEVPNHAVESVLKIRRELVSLRQRANRTTLLFDVSSRLQAACRRFLDVLDGPDGNVSKPFESPFGNGLRFIDALGQLRGTFGENLEILSIYFDESLPETLASMTLAREITDEDHSNA